VGTVTGRARRCGWFDAPLLKRSMIINGVSGMCITKLDVLDGLPEIQMAWATNLGGNASTFCRWTPTTSPACEPVYETFPGWTETTPG
jgi:adenylosuccinate synthase